MMKKTGYGRIVNVSSGMGGITEIEGVDTTVYLSTLPDDGPTGTFFRKRAPILW